MRMMVHFRRENIYTMPFRTQDFHLYHKTKKPFLTIRKPTLSRNLFGMIY